MNLVLLAVIHLGLSSPMFLASSPPYHMSLSICPCNHLGTFWHPLPPHTCMHAHRQELSGHMRPPVLSTQGEGPDTSNDLLLAQMLQLEFDRQHDRLVGAEERVYNRDSKGKGVCVVCVGVGLGAEERVYNRDSKGEGVCVVCVWGWGQRRG